MLLKGVSVDTKCAISIERLDDVAFEEGGTTSELIQLKHTLYAQHADLTDTSERLWKTLRIWSLKLKDESAQIEHVILSLVTTGTTADGSAARKLRESQDRNEVEALEALREVAIKAKNKANRKAHQAFMDLTLEQQQLLMSRIRILDNQENIIQIKDRMVSEFRVYTPYYDALYSRLEGWWFDQAVSHLVGTDKVETISGDALTTRIWELSDQLKSDNLPNDYLDILEMDESALSSNERIFVEQLKLIVVGQTRIRLAIGHYYRAFQQRTKWLDEGLLFPSELAGYEKYLQQEWRTQFEIMKEDLGNLPSEADIQKLGKRLFDNLVETKSLQPIRARYFDTGFSKGTFHSLANRQLVGWHAEFSQRLSDIMMKGARQAI